MRAQRAVLCDGGGPSLSRLLARPVTHACATARMGFPLEMFVHPDQISRALLCSICHELPMEPKQCKSGHVFCRDCIVRWLQQEEVCPMDRSQLRTEELSDCLVVKVRGAFCVRSGAGSREPP